MTLINFGTFYYQAFLLMNNLKTYFYIEFIIIVKSSINKNKELIKFIFFQFLNIVRSIIIFSGWSNIYTIIINVMRVNMLSLNRIIWSYKRNRLTFRNKSGQITSSIKVVRRNHNKYSPQSLTWKCFISVEWENNNSLHVHVSSIYLICTRLREMLSFNSSYQSVESTFSQRHDKIQLFQHPVITRRASLLKGTYLTFYSESLTIISLRNIEQLWANM